MIMITLNKLIKEIIENRRFLGKIDFANTITLMISEGGSKNHWISTFFDDFFSAGVFQHQNDFSDAVKSVLQILGHL